MILRNKIAVITGGSRGIGRAIAEEFSKEGAKVVIIARNPDEVKKSGFFGIRADVSNSKQIRAAFAKIRRKFGRIDILINAAGIQPPIGPFYKNDLREWEKNIAVNLFGTVACVQEVLPEMIKRKKGKIINFAGGGATGSRPTFSAYAAAKTAVVRLTEILGEELRPFNIQVNAISPGAVRTFMTREVLKYSKLASKDEIKYSQDTLKSGGVPPELAAKLVLFLVSAKADGLTGRLISAPWDNWQKWGKKDIQSIMRSEKYTLRRVK